MQRSVSHQRTRQARRLLDEPVSLDQYHRIHQADETQRQDQPQLPLAQKHHPEVTIQQDQLALEPQRHLLPPQDQKREDLAVIKNLLNPL